MKVPFLKRFCAYMVDFLIIYMIVFLITLFVPVSDSYSKSIEERDALASQVVDGEIDYATYFDQYNEKSYYVVKEGAVFILVQFVVYMAYFGTFAYYNNGQTFGKRFMKIRIKSSSGNSMSHFNFIVRSIVLYGLYADIITVFLSYLLPCSYANYIFAITYVQAFIVYASLFMILFRKDGRGIHDFISNSKVVECN